MFTADDEEPTFNNSPVDGGVHPCGSRGGGKMEEEQQEGDTQLCSILDLDLLCDGGDDHHGCCDEDSQGDHLPLSS